MATVFIGSSSEAVTRGLVGDVAEWLQALGHKPLRWDDREAFIASEFVFSGLIRLSKLVDAAVFVFADDDTIWYRNDQTTQPRANVLIEYGLFSGVLGPANVVICKEGNSAIPTDLGGIIYIDVSSDKRAHGRNRLENWAKNIHPPQNLPGTSATRSPAVDVEEIAHEIAPEMQRQGDGRTGGSGVSAPSGRRSTPVRPDPPGVVSAEDIRGTGRRLDGEVFATELLTEPIELICRDDRVIVQIDRRNVEKVLISNEGKLAKVQELVTPGNVEALEKLDRRVQQFLEGTDCDESSLRIDLPALGINLRWASGGVLSIVNYLDRRWVPCFFRDIRPYGWNISLGTSERWFKDDGSLREHYSWEQELRYPWRFCLREFLEETLIVKQPSQRGAKLGSMDFEFANVQAEEVLPRGTHWNEVHRRLREKEDGLHIERLGERKVTLCETDYRIEVLYEDGEPPARSGNVLVCFSPLDLGIEIVKVAQFSLASDEWLLDGEIREDYDPASPTTHKQLIHQPIAMISLEFLKSMFNRPVCYTLGPQPSIRVKRAPRPEANEIILFPWDVRQRLKAVKGEWGTQWQRARFVDWYDKFFLRRFGNCNEMQRAERLAEFDPSMLFVPGTAKILSLFFKQRLDQKLGGA